MAHVLQSQDSAIGDELAPPPDAPIRVRPPRKAKAAAMEKLGAGAIKGNGPMAAKECSGFPFCVLASILNAKEPGKIKKP